VSTWLLYISTGKFLPWNAWPDANNHFLNSLSARISYLIFGNEIWALRLPNVLSSVVFFISVIGISKFLKHTYLQIAFVLVLFFTHGFLEFFGYARGYGISMAFMMFALWMIFTMKQSGRVVFLSLSLLSLMIALMANLTLLPSSGFLLVYIAALWISAFRRSSKTQNLIFIVALSAFVALYMYAASYSLMLKGMNLLYYGGETGFFNAIVKTHGKMLFFSENKILLFSMIAMSCISLGLFIVLFVRDQFKLVFDPGLTLFPLLFFGSLAAIIVLNKFSGINFPEDRTSLFLYPYCIGCLIFAVDGFQSRWKFIVIIPFLFVPVNFAANMNTAFSFHWHYERIPVDFPQKVKETAMHTSPGNITISGYKIHELIWGHHVSNHVQGVNLLNPLNYPNNLDDYILLRQEEADSMPGYFDAYSVLLEDPYSKLQLLKRKVPPARELIFQKSILQDINETTDEFINFFPDTMFDFRGNALLFQFDIDFADAKGPDGSVIVVSVRDSTNNNLKYQRIETDWLSNDPDMPFSYSLSVLNISENTAGIIVYIWNKHRNTLKIKHAKVSVYEFEATTQHNERF